MTKYQTDGPHDRLFLVLPIVHLHTPWNRQSIWYSHIPVKPLRQLNSI